MSDTPLVRRRAPPPPRDSPARPRPKEGSSSPSSSNWQAWRRTITYEQALHEQPWQTDNDHIRTGYRTQIPSLRGCIWSSFTFLHNETVNIHSHSLGALFFAILIPLHLIPTHFPSFGFSSDPLPTPPTAHDTIALVFDLLCAVTCLGLSSWFHTVSCHSREVCEIAHRGDYLGIVILTCGTILSGLSFTFYDDLPLMLTYMALIFMAGVASAYTVLSPRQRAHRWRRTLTFIALGLSAVIPVVHAIRIKGLEHARGRMGLDLVIAGGASYIFGAVLYAARIPERFSPGTFDYFGSSHQIFHCFVLAGAGLQYAALRAMVWGRSVGI